MSNQTVTSGEIEPPVSEQVSGAVATLTLERPAQYNVLSDSMLAALQNALDRLAKRRDVRVIVLAARGKAFCAGHDLREMRASEDMDFHRDLFARCSQLMQTLIRQPQPVIARVQGIATAAGCQLVASCDLAVAAAEARFATSGVNLGLFCGTPAVALSRNVPAKQAMELLLTGEFIDAPRARELGLVNRVVPADYLDRAVQELALTIAAKPEPAIRAGKELFYRQLQVGLGDAYQMASETMACNMNTPEAREGIDAFIQKRPPRWT